jgi:hypothetical protein
MDNIYKNKYLKYKTKYLELKNQLGRGEYVDTKVTTRESEYKKIEGEQKEQESPEGILKQMTQDLYKLVLRVKDLRERKKKASTEREKENIQKEIVRLEKLYWVLDDQTTKQTAIVNVKQMTQDSIKLVLQVRDLRERKRKVSTEREKENIQKEIVRLEKLFWVLDVQIAEQTAIVNVEQMTQDSIKLVLRVRDLRERKKKASTEREKENIQKEIVRLEKLFWVLDDQITRHSAILNVKQMTQDSYKLVLQVRDLRERKRKVSTESEKESIQNEIVRLEKLFWVLDEQIPEQSAIVNAKPTESEAKKSDSSVKGNWYDEDPN